MGEEKYQNKLKGGVSHELAELPEYSFSTRSPVKVDDLLPKLMKCKLLSKTRAQATTCSSINVRNGVGLKTERDLLDPVREYLDEHVD